MKFIKVNNCFDKYFRPNLAKNCLDQNMNRSEIDKKANHVPRNSTRDNMLKSSK